MSRDLWGYGWRTASNDDMITLYHHTSPQSADRILRDGFMGDWRDHIFLSTKPHDPELRGNEWVGHDRYDTVLETRLPRHVLGEDEVQPLDTSVRWYTAPIELVNRAPVRLHSRTAARLAMPTWYHLTNDPDFTLDPDHEPANYNGMRPFGKGVFLTQRPDEWAYTEDDGGWSGDRPYVAEIDAPENLHEKLMVWHDPDASRPGDPFPGAEEIFVPDLHFHKLRVRNVRPRKQGAKTTMSAAVTVYTKPSCPQCDMTKKVLDRLGIEHDTVDVTADPDAHAYVTGLGYAQAPVVVVGDGEVHWSGFSPDKLKGLVE